MFQKFVFPNKNIHNVETGWSNIILFWLITWVYVEILWRLCNMLLQTLKLSPSVMISDFTGLHLCVWNLDFLKVFALHMSMSWDSWEYKTW